MLKIVDNNDRPLPGFYAELHTYLLTAYIYLATITPWALVYIYTYLATPPLPQLCRHLPLSEIHVRHRPYLPDLSDDPSQNR